MIEQIEAIALCGYPHIVILRGVFFWRVSIYSTLAPSEFGDESLAKAIEKAAAWAESHKIGPPGEI